MHKLSKFCCGLVLCFISLVAVAQNHPALLVGNATYQYTGKLKNPHQDVKALAEVLRQRGFDVMQVLDADKMQMERALGEFLRKLSQTKKGFVYYAGHGVQLEGKNYLLPVDVRSASATALEANALSLQTLLDAVGKISPEAVTIVLDACRDNPFSGSQSQAAPRGLGEAGQMIPKGIIVAYGASAGQGAIDSLGDQDTNPNGLFTRHLLRFLRDDTLSIQQVMRRVRDAVMTDAKTVQHRQIPSTYDASLPGHALLPQPKAQFVEPLLRPPKNIRLIVPAASGGPTDFIAKRLEERLREFGVSTQIENIIDIPGERVSAMEYPFSIDSVTLLMSNYPASLRRELANDRRFKAVGMVAETPMMLATNLHSGIRDMKTLAALTATRSIAWKVGISGPGSQSEACISVLKNTLGTSKIESIVLRGVAPTLTEMLSGRIDLVCEVQPVFDPQVKGGKLRFVANLQEDASPESEIPTSQSQGYAAVAPNWTAIFAPSQLPTPALTALTDALRQAVTDPRFAARLREGSARAVPAEKFPPLEVDMSLRLGAEIARQ